MSDESKVVKLDKMTANLRWRSGHIIDLETDIRSNVSSKYDVWSDTQSISTSHSKSQNFFVKDDDGREQPIVLKNSSLPLRKGSRVAYVELEEKGRNGKDSQKQKVAAVANLDTGHHTFNIQRMNSVQSLTVHAMMWFGVFFLFLMLTGVLNLFDVEIFSNMLYEGFKGLLGDSRYSSFNLMTYIGISLILYYVIIGRKIRKALKFDNEVYDHVSKMVKSLEVSN